MILFLSKQIVKQSFQRLIINIC